MVDHMNDRVLDIPGDTVTYLSADSVAEVDQQSVYPTEYLNSLILSGLPPQTQHQTRHSYNAATKHGPVAWPL